MRILAINHQHDAGPGVFAEAIRARGDVLDEWNLAEDEQAPDDPPADPFEYDAVMTFGGAMHADQDDGIPWIIPERKLLSELLAAEVPLLGACLGAQLLCQAAGGSVRRMPEPEIGWYDVEVAAEGSDDPLLGALAPGFTGFNWHSYECLPPDGAAILARSSNCVQAYRVGDFAWGIQFHAEVSVSDARLWIDDWRSDEDAVRIGLDVDALRADTDRQIAAWNQVGRELCGRFLDTVAVKV
jgi:GMP synthase-like glutamine amidotransferase